MKLKAFFIVFEGLPFGEKIKNSRPKFQKFVALPSPDRVYKKRAGQNIFLIYILLSRISHKYIILAMLTLESKVIFFFFLLHRFSFVHVAVLPTVLCAGFTRLRYTMRSNKPIKTSAAAIRNLNDEKNFHMRFKFKTLQIQDWTAEYQWPAFIKN